MATADIVILIVVLLSAAIGLMRGLLKEVLSLASWLTAFVAALYFAPVLSARFETVVDDQSVRLVVAFILIFLVVLVLGGLIQWVLSKMVHGTGLSGTDRFLGFLFGSARGVLACIIALIALRPFAEGTDWWQASMLVPELLAFEDDVLNLLGKATEWFSEIDFKG